MVKTEPFVSIIILNYNGKNFLDKCLSSVLKTDYPQFEVVLVDNASNDNSLEFAKNAFGMDRRLVWVENVENLGFGPANNIGFKHAKGDYVAFLNNDTIVSPSWLRNLVEVMACDDSVGLVQSLILDYDSKKVQTAGWLVSDFYVALFSLRSKNVNLADLPASFEISYASGAAMMTRREIALRIGLFDPKYFWFYDDTYLSFKVWLIGKRVVTSTRSIVSHFGGGTAGTVSFFIRWQNTACFISLIFDVYWKALDLVKGLFIFSYVLEIETIKEVLEHHRTTRIWSNFYAFYWILRNFRHIWRKRLAHMRISEVSQNVLLSRIVRIHLPASLYLVPSPSKLLWDSLYAKLERYEKELVSATS
jgi:GT2 family glycosyltransferase